MLKEWVYTFAHDTKVHIALFIVIVDILFGVAAAAKSNHNFRFSYLADFARNDILEKLLPYFALYVLALVAGSTDIVIPGLDFGVFAGATYVALVVALTASILNSLNELGITTKLSAKMNPGAALAVFGSENSSPPKD